MRTIFLSIFLLILFSCKLKQEIGISEINSNSYVTISEDFKKENNDSICLNIPLEFEINFPEDTDKVTFDLLKNNHYQQYINDYTIKYFKNNKIQTLYEGINLKDVENPKKIKLRLYIKNNLVSKKVGDNLLAKYADANIKSDKIGKTDSIKLNSYAKFRKENIDVMSTLRKQDDFLVINIRKHSEKKYSSTKYKIKW